MALKSVQAAAASGSALVVLDAELQSVLWANRAGERLLGRAASDDVVRQIGTAGEAFAAKGRTQLLLRPASASGLGRAVLARLERIALGDRSLALLSVKLGLVTRTPAQEAEDALEEAGLEAALACVVDRDGLVAATPALPREEHSLLAVQGREFLLAEEDRLIVEDEAGALSFARISPTLALIHVDMIDEAVAAASVPDAPEAPDDAPAASMPAGAPLPAVDTPEDEALAVPVATLPPALEEQPPIGTPPPPPLAPAPFHAELGAEPVRFVWQIDADTCFSHLSPEFASAVGPRAADVIGRSFADVARVFGFDENGEIERLLQRRDTWSGRSIFWPLEGTDRRAPVDLAALPVYSRGRDFLGFRGFGVVRPGEHEADPAAIGLALAIPGRDREDVLPDAKEPDPSKVPDTSEAEDAERTFGRRAAPPPVPADPRRREGTLSSAEAAAFRAIGAELGLPIPPSTPLPPLATSASVSPAAPVLQGTSAREEEPKEPEELLLPVQELEDMLDALPLAVLVQMQDRLIFANRRFFALTRYEDLDALEDAGGLDRLIQTSGSGEGDEDAVLMRADGTIERARLHLQRISVAGRSCLLMSFPPAAVPEDEETFDTDLLDLEREVEELQAVLDTATDGILLLDEEERIRKMNGAAEALFGVRPDTYAGQPLRDLLTPESGQSLSDYIGTLRDNGLASILNDGREVVARVGSSGGTIPLFVTLGRLSEGRGWCVVIRDIAQWKTAEAELVEARRQAEDASLHKSRFLANISHELRTPLNAIIGFADVMASECFGPIGHERYLEYLGDIKRSGHHVLDLVNDLLDISKIEAGKVDLAFEAVSLNEVVAEVVSLMQPQANRERVIVRSVLPASVPAVVADRRSVRQIALNLIANAVRFTPAGGQIVASTHYDNDGNVTLRFRDSGIGMTEREIEIALTPFQQVNAGRGDRGEGTGLGLPLTKAMTEANRAQFSIASTPGEGTLVEILFPAQRVLAG